MTEPEHREEVWAALERELRKDRAKNQALKLSEFGLVEITRKRSRENLARLLTRPCPECGGSGRILAITTICLKLRREVLGRCEHLGDHKLVVQVHPEVAAALDTDQRDILDELRGALGSQLEIQPDDRLQHERYEIIEV